MWPAWGDRQHERRTFRRSAERLADFRQAAERYSHSPADRATSALARFIFANALMRAKRNFRLWGRISRRVVEIVGSILKRCRCLSSHEPASERRFRRQELGPRSRRSLRLKAASGSGVPCAKSSFRGILSRGRGTGEGKMGRHSTGRPEMRCTARKVYSAMWPEQTAPLTSTAPPDLGGDFKAQRLADKRWRHPG